MVIRFVRTVLLFILLALPVEGMTAELPPLRVGLLPTIATLSLIRLYDPLRQYLQRTLGRPVDLYTAPNYRAYFTDIVHQEFDVLVSASHFGVRAVEEGYVPLVRYQLELRPLIVVPKGSAIHGPDQLAGKRILTGDRLTALSVVAEHWLERDYHMVAGRDYLLTEASNHGTALRAVAIGDADAAISGQSPLQQVPADIRAKLDLIDCPLAVPHQFILAHPRLGADIIARLRVALTAFPATTEGRAFFAASGFRGFVALSPQDIEAARPYAVVANRMMGEDGP